MVNDVLNGELDIVLEVLNGSFAILTSRSDVEINVSDEVLDGLDDALESVTFGELGFEHFWLLAVFF